jgi:hypothetical protein
MSGFAIFPPVKGGSELASGGLAFFAPENQPPARLRLTAPFTGGKTRS